VRQVLLLRGELSPDSLSFVVRCTYGVLNFVTRVMMSPLDRIVRWCREVRTATKNGKK
jgi:hypothetical protein